MKNRFTPSIFLFYRSFLIGSSTGRKKMASLEVFPLCEVLLQNMPALSFMGLC